MTSKQCCGQSYPLVRSAYKLTHTAQNKQNLLKTDSESGSASTTTNRFGVATHLGSEENILRPNFPTGGVDRQLRLSMTMRTGVRRPQDGMTQGTT